MDSPGVEVLAELDRSKLAERTVVALGDGQGLEPSSTICENLGMAKVDWSYHRAG